MIKSWKVSLLAGALLAAFSAGTQAAEEGNWMVRLRAVNLHWADKSDGGGPLGLPSDAVTVKDKTIPEVDISYFFTKNIATELVLTYPQKLDVNIKGMGNVGDFKALPPTLLLQYHFMPDATFRPYVGAGVNYTRITSVHLLNGAGDLENHSVGAALQVGFDVKLAPQWFLNVDVKKLWISSDVKVDGVGKVTKVDLDPIAVGVGVGYRF